MRLTAFIAAALIMAAPAWAKLPPLSDDAKAKAAEATAKTGHGNKVAEYKLCQAQDRVAAKYVADAKKAGKDVAPGTTPSCADPGAFAYTPTAPKPIEAAGAHSPPDTAAKPPSTTVPAAATSPTPKN